MNNEERCFTIPFAEEDQLRFEKSLQQIMAMGGRINMGYQEGSFIVPVPFLEKEIKGRYEIDSNGYLKIFVEEAPPGMDPKDVKDLYLEHLGFKDNYPN